MTFTRREEKRIRELVKLGSMDAWDNQKKDILGVCMTRKECLGIHQGRHSQEAVNGNGGSLRKEKVKFWAKVTGLISGLTVLITIIIAILSAVF